MSSPPPFCRGGGGWKFCNVGKKGGTCTFWIFRGEGVKGGTDFFRGKDWGFSESNFQLLIKYPIR